MWTSSYAVDILAVLRLTNGTIYREKTEIINPWGVRRSPQPPPNDALVVNGDMQWVTHRKQQKS